MIAFDSDNGLVYEGRANYGHAVWPVPVISVATMVEKSSTVSEVPENHDLASADLIFREDSFDPVTRIKRGRFYSFSEGSRNPYWNVQVHPMLPGESRRVSKEGLIQKQLWNWYEYSISVRLKSYSSLPTVVLGTKNAHTRWKIVGIERTINGDELVTMRAQANLGMLPELITENIPEVSRQKTQEAIEKLVETIYRSGPESIVSRCRDAASAILGGYLWRIEPEAPLKDLGALIKILRRPPEKEQMAIIISAATIIARLHPREKPNEQIARDLRPLYDGDAEIAVNCVATLLREVNFALI
jgi:hypothetical protein